MKTRLLLVATVFACISCCDDDESEIKSDSLHGLWNLEKVTIAGTNTIEYDNSPANFLQLDGDKKFSRAYESGNWILKGRNLTLDRDETFGMVDWSYQIISITNTGLVVEMQLIESEYRWNFESFADDELLTIREVYAKSK